MATMRSDVRKKLIRVAKTGKTIVYKELMNEFHIPRGGRSPGIGIGYVVGTISEYESKKDHLLSAIVVRKGSIKHTCPYGTPGGGFFGIPTPIIPNKLKRTESEYDNPLTHDDLIFIQDQQNKVWRYWKTHEDDEKQ
jgi:hypothetical protein